MEENEIASFFVQCKEDLISLDIPIATHIEGIFINRRAKKRFGCCKAVKKGKNIWYRIEIGEFLLNGSEWAIRNVIYHELLHTCPGCMNHGAMWKFYAQKTDKKYGSRLRAASRYEELGLTPPQENSPVRYVVQCEQCGMEIHRSRKSKLITYMKQYRCGNCGGKLRLLQQESAEIKEGK